MRNKCSIFKIQIADYQRVLILICILILIVFSPFSKSAAKLKKKPEKW